jgi:hypothetical protein
MARTPNVSLAASDNEIVAGDHVEELQTDMFIRPSPIRDVFHRRRVV